MANYQEVRGSRAYRLAYRSGLLFRHAFKAMKTHSSSSAGRSGTENAPTKRLMLTVGIVCASVVIVAAMLLVGVWLLAFLVTILTMAVMGWFGNFVRSRDDNPGPDYLGASEYIGDFDDNGHYIGGCKSPD